MSIRKVIYDNDEIYFEIEKDNAVKGISCFRVYTIRDVQLLLQRGLHIDLKIAAPKKI